MNQILTAENLIFLLKGAGISLALALGALLIGMVIGVLLAAGRLSKIKIFNWLCGAYVEIFRGTPMLLQIMFFHIISIFLSLKFSGLRMKM